jgi:flagellar protein FlaG
MDINSLSTSAIENSTLQSGVKPAVEIPKQQQIETSVATSASESPPEARTATLEKVAQVNSRLEQLGVGLAFYVDESTQSSVVKVIDRTTDEVIKQYPNEGSLEMMKHIQSYLESVQKSGILNKEGLTGVLLNEII